jgi:hypothetical protein
MQSIKKKPSVPGEIKFKEYMGQCHDAVGGRAAARRTGRAIVRRAIRAVRRESMSSET